MKLNSRLWAGLSLLVAMPLAAMADKGTFTLKGTINGFEGSYIKMLYQEGNEIKTDSVKIVGGKFSFSGHLQEPMALRSLAIGDVNDYDNRKICTLYVEPKVITVSIDKANFSRPEVTGSLSQAQSDSLYAMQRQGREEMQKIRDAQKNEKDAARKEALEKQLDECQNKMLVAQIAWVKAHPSSLIAPMQMRFLMGNMSYKEIEDVYANFTPEVRKMPDCKDIEAEMKTLKLIQPGQPAPYFRAKGNDGKMISLADLKGKYVLLDFWATWCVPCRKSFPHVKALYTKYKDKGFDVFCVADDDNNEAKWKDVIVKDGIQNFHHVLRGLVWDRNKGLAGMDRTNDISDKYAVHYLPTKYLIDKEGRMVGKFDDAALDAKLKEIFGF